MKGIATVEAYLGLGTNQGDRWGNLEHAAKAIHESGFPLLDQSRVYETQPWGYAKQPAFLNQVLKVHCPYSPAYLIEKVLSIEKELGRIRRQKWESRIIDIDVLYYGDKDLEFEGLIVPHPGIPERRFVLIPLGEVAPDFLHPTLQKTTLQMLEECPDDLDVMPYNPAPEQALKKPFNP